MARGELLWSGGRCQFLCGPALRHSRMRLVSRSRQLDDNIFVNPHLAGCDGDWPSLRMPAFSTFGVAQGFSWCPGARGQEPKKRAKRVESFLMFYSVLSRGWWCPVSDVHVKRFQIWLMIWFMKTMPTWKFTLPFLGKWGPANRERHQWLFQGEQSHLGKPFQT